MASVRETRTTVEAYAQLKPTLCHAALSRNLRRWHPENGLRRITPTYRLAACRLASKHLTAQRLHKGVPVEEQLCAQSKHLNARYAATWIAVSGKHVTAVMRAQNVRWSTCDDAAAALSDIISPLGPRRVREADRRYLSRLGNVNCATSAFPLATPRPPPPHPQSHVARLSGSDALMKLDVDAPSWGAATRSTRPGHGPTSSRSRPELLWKLVLAQFDDLLVKMLPPSDSFFCLA